MDVRDKTQRTSISEPIAYIHPDKLLSYINVPNICSLIEYKSDISYLTLYTYLYQSIPFVFVESASPFSLMYVYLPGHSFNYDLLYVSLVDRENPDMKLYKSLITNLTYHITQTSRLIEDVC